jgi:hypothetical protein
MGVKSHLDDYKEALLRMLKVPGYGDGYWDRVAARTDLHSATTGK